MFNNNKLIKSHRNTSQKYAIKRERERDDDDEERQILYKYKE